MPDALLKQCTGPGCANLTEKIPCPDCSKRRESFRGSRHERGYDNDWQRDAAIFKRAYPFCGMRPDGVPPVMSRCHDEGRVTPAYQVDHVVPHRQNPTLFKDRSLPVVKQPNWQSLCRSCGGAKSAAGL